jgi:rRNA maturation endonuclease Nob1
MFPDKLLVKHIRLTPEQAITDTLGLGTCCIEHYDTDILLNEDYYRCTACHSEIFHNLGYRFCPYCGQQIEVK